jgi:hypothetical protein
VKYASAFVCFPGGFGTLDEFFETLTLVQTLKIDVYPIILFGSKFWSGLRSWMQDQLMPKFIDSEDIDIFRIVDDPKEVVKAICIGTVSAGFLEDRAALNVLREKPAECEGKGLRLASRPHLTLPLGVGSTFAAAAAADRIRDEIGGLFRDGTLAALMAKYSYFGLDDTWTTGASAQSAAAALRLAGAQSVAVIVLGRHLPPAPGLPAFETGRCAVHQCPAPAGRPGQ